MWENDTSMLLMELQHFSYSVNLSWDFMQYQSIKH